MTAMMMVTLMMVVVVVVLRMAVMVVVAVVVVAAPADTVLVVGTCERGTGSGEAGAVTASRDREL